MSYVLKNYLPGVGASPFKQIKKAQRSAADEQEFTQGVGASYEMVDPGARLYSTSGYNMADPTGRYMNTLGSAGDIIGTVFDVITSRAGATIIAGTLTYLLFKSPAARKELWGTAKGQYHRAKARLGKKKGGFGGLTIPAGSKL